MAINAVQERYNSLRTILTTIVRDQMEVTCIMSGQNAPRPALPYVSIYFGENLEEVGTHEWTMDSEGQEYSRITYNLSVDISVFTDSETRFNNSENFASSIIEDIKIKLSRPDNTSALNASNLVYVEGGLVTSASTILNTTFEPKAVCTLKFRTNVKELFNSGEIDTVSVSGKYLNPNGETIDTSFNIDKN